MQLLLHQHAHIGRLHLAAMRVLDASHCTGCTGEAFVVVEQLLDASDWDLALLFLLLLLDQQLLQHIWLLPCL